LTSNQIGCNFDGSQERIMPIQINFPTRYRKLVSFILLVITQTTALPICSQTKFTLPTNNVSALTRETTKPDLKQNKTDLFKAFGRLPLSFELNQGQTDEQVKFLSRGNGYALFLTPSEAVLALTKNDKKRTSVKSVGEPEKPLVRQRQDVLRMKFVNGNPETKITGEEERTGKSNYFRGNNPEQWKNNVPNYGRVRYENIYPNIDLVFYGNRENLEYDFIVAPTASSNVISMSLEGVSKLRLDAKGNLVLKTKYGEIIQSKPFVYQETGEKKITIQANYVIQGQNQFGFSIGEYDKNLPLVIDPVISYSTYVGGSFYDYGNGIAVDTLGNAYIAGQTLSANFPLKNPIQPVLSGDNDAFITKINASGTEFVYSTYLGGSQLDGATGVAVDTSGNAYLVGSTSSTNFPRLNAIQPTFGGGLNDAFVTKINDAGTALVYSTYLGGAPVSGVGGNDEGNAINVDADGNAYLTGYTSSNNFPLANAAQPVKASRIDCFATKLNPAGTGFVFSTFLGGGSNTEAGSGIASDSAGNAYVTGETASTNFCASCSYQNYSGDVDGFVTKYTSSGAIAFSTYLGGSSTDYGYGGIAVDSFGNIYAAGTTRSTNFPRMNALQQVLGGGYDAYVSKLNPTGTGLVFSTYLGGSGDDVAYGIAVDAPGNVYLTGETFSSNFPLSNAFQTSRRGTSDAFITKINASGTTLGYSTYYGGNNVDGGTAVAVNSCGEPYVIGATDSNDFPTTTSSAQTSHGGARDAFVTKIGDTKLAGVAPDATVPGSGEVGVGYYAMPESIDPEIMTDRKTKVEAQVFYPKSFTDPRPLIIFLHGNHPTCGESRIRANQPRPETSVKYTIDGNCQSLYTEIEAPSYKGYEYLATELARVGYFVFSVNANLGITGANTGDFDDDPFYIQARGRLVLKHLQRLYEWNTNGTPPAITGTIGINLRNRLDFNNIGLMGHSRGGEGVRAAYNIYNNSSSVPSPEAALLDEIILDNTSPTGVEIVGSWRAANTDEGFYGTDYLTDDNTGHGTKSVKFTPAIPVSGPYRVYLRWSRIPGSSPPTRASNVPVEIIHDGGITLGSLSMNMAGDNIWRWHFLNTYNFSPGPGGSIKLSNTGTNGQVIADAVRLVSFVSPPATPWKARIPFLNIKGIFEIGPTDTQFPSPINVEGTAWNVLLPMCDRDVSRLSGVQVFDRSMLGSAAGIADTTQKSTYTVWGANHNFYNTQWQFDEFINTPSTRCIGFGNTALFGDSVTPPNFLNSLAQRQTALASLKAFFLANVGAFASPSFNQNFNTRYELPLAVNRITRVDRGYAFTPNGGQTIIIDDFNKSGPGGIDGPGAGNTSNGITITYGRPEPMQRIPLHSPGLQSGKIEWTTADGNNYFQTTLTSPVNLTTYNTLDFRISRQTNLALNVPGATNITIQLVKNDGSLSEPVELCKYTTLIGPVGSYFRDTSTFPPTIGQVYKPILQTVRIPLSDFSTDLSQIKGVRFTFNITPRGAVWLANIRTSRLP
jgi:hypothetical protein